MNNDQKTGFRRHLKAQFAISLKDMEKASWGGLFYTIFFMMIIEEITKHFVRKNNYSLAN